MKTVRRCGLAGVILILAGCASDRINWDAQVGVMTYRQAVQALGQPSRINNLPDGKTVAEWVSFYTYDAYNPAMDQTFYNGAASFSPVTHQQLMKSTLDLTFDTNNILTRWSQE